MNPINPKVSLWTKDYHPYKSDKLEELDLYTVLKHCENIDPSALKGKSGSIFPYLSSSIDATDKYSDGVLFIDFDHCSDISKTIYDSFDELCNILPNILGVNFSFSGNLHFYMYDLTVKENPQKYGVRNTFWMCCLAQAIKKITTIDLRTIDGCMDPHSKYFTQRLFLSRSSFRWNVNCCALTISKSDEKRIKTEYHKWFSFNKVKPIVMELPMLEFNGTINVDSDFVINTHKGPVSGYLARTVIVASTYHHFGCDIEKTATYICERYENAKAMCDQLRSMVSTGSVRFLWDSTTERILFPSTGGTILKSSKYLSDVVNLDKELKHNKYLYICSNTGTGKTELVKKYINDHPDKKVVYIQMMKSILSGKVEGVENITIYNTDMVENVREKVHMHLTIDKIVRTFERADPKEYTIFVDESHLLQDHISFRLVAIKKLCQILTKVDRVVFLSATPKSDVRLLDFKVLTYTKIQNQKLTIHQIPVRVKNRLDPISVYFNYMIKDIEMRAKDRHVTIFSNKREERWLSCGLRDKDITRFRSEFFDDENVLSVLNDNKIKTKWCLSTSYMSVGVEVKEGKHLIVFDIDEGIDISHLIQSIGRFRPGYITEIEVLIYYRVGKLPSKLINDEVVNNFDTIWDNLVVNTDEGNVANILSTKLLRLSDVDIPIEAVRMIRILKQTNIEETNEYYSPHSYQILKSLPYKSIKVTNEEIVEVDTENIQRRSVPERELLEYLKSCDNSHISSLAESKEGYALLWSSGLIPYNDKVASRKLIRKSKYIVNMELPFGKTMEFFEDQIDDAYTIATYLKDYVRLKRKERVVVDFQGSDNVHSKLDKGQRIVKEVFTQEFLDYVSGNVRVNLFVDMVTKDPNMEILCSVFGLDVEIGETLDIEIFRGDSYKECLRRISQTELRSLGGKSSSPKKVISIINTETDEKKTFESKGDCMKFLNMSSRTFSKFVKGSQVRNCKWTVSMLTV